MIILLIFGMIVGNATQLQFKYDHCKETEFKTSYCKTQEYLSQYEIKK